MTETMMAILGGKAVSTVLWGMCAVLCAWSGLELAAMMVNLRADSDLLYRGFGRWMPKVDDLTEVGQTHRRRYVLATRIFFLVALLLAIRAFVVP